MSTFLELDHKQRSLIDSWISYGTGANRDHYGRFMSLWVAFNAICYGFYSSIANRKRADLQQDRGLSEVTDQPARLDGTIVSATDRVKLQIEKPGKIVITIAERYTEDIIFSRFAEEFQSQYLSWLTNKDFETDVQAFREVIRKRERYYLINMARALEHNDEDDYDEMKRRNVIVAFEDPTNLKQLKNLLYQVRCNIFHGEKVPGDPNDDRIVQAAYPVLLRIVRNLVPECTDE